MAKICCEKPRDRHDHIIVQEKLDGSCCAVALVEDEVVALGRAGWTAATSPYEQHQMFATWVRQNEDRFRGLLLEGERVVGEWLAQAHGTRYNLSHEPFVAFDLMTKTTRLSYQEFCDRVAGRFIIPHLVSQGQPMLTSEAMRHVEQQNAHGAIDPIEGVVYRVERKGRVEFLAKFVRPDKQDGIYLHEVSGRPNVWNWTLWEPKH
jgi:ATP-dependent RNA circularization protein (DNA/RNA ligase family)